MKYLHARARVPQARGDGRRRTPRRRCSCVIGKAGDPVTHLSQAYPDRVEVRGRDLAGDLMGRLTLHRVLPPAAHRARADRGAALLPRPAARRDRRARDDADERRRADDARGRPRTRCRAPSRRGSSAPARSSSARPRSARGCSRRRRRGSRRREPGGRRRDVAERCTRPAARCPGFGHPVHRAARPARRADPRARRRARRRAGRTSRSRARSATPSPRSGASRCTMNVSMPIAAVHARPRLPGRRREGGSDPRAHRRPARAPRRGAGAAARLPPGGEGRGGGRVRASDARVMLAPEVETRPWDEQLALDDASYRDAARLPLRALGRSTARSSARPGSPPRRRGRARRHRAAAADREGASSRRRARADNPFGAHLCATPREIVRIYSTSGTTGTPSYIPLTAGDLDNWVDGLGAQLRGLGHRRRPADRLDLQRRARSSPGPRSPPSTASASATSRSAPGTPSG